MKNFAPVQYGKPLIFEHDKKVYHMNSTNTALVKGQPKKQDEKSTTPAKPQPPNAQPAPAPALVTQKPHIKNVVNLALKKQATFSKGHADLPKQSTLALGFAAAAKQPAISVKEAKKEEETADVEMKDDLPKPVDQLSNGIHGLDLSQEEVKQGRRKKRQRQISEDEELDVSDITHSAKKSNKRNLNSQTSSHFISQQESVNSIQRFMKKSEKKQNNRVISDDEKPTQKKALNKKGMKRVLKEKMFTNEQGYFVVEEYSSYEEYTPAELAEQQKLAAQKKAPQKQAMLKAVH